MRTLSEEYELTNAIFEKDKYDSIIDKIERLENVIYNYYIRGLDSTFCYAIFAGVEPTALYQQKAEALDKRAHKANNGIQHSIHHLAKLKQHAQYKRDKHQRTINELWVK